MSDSLFTLNQPCVTCVVRKDRPFLGLRPGRKEAIVESVTQYGQPFTCHKLAKFSDDEEDESRATNLPWDHCAGLRALLEADPVTYSTAYVNIARKQRPDLHVPVDVTGIELFATLAEWVDAGEGIGR